jgi:hypothetical protein
MVAHPGITRTHVYGIRLTFGTMSHSRKGGPSFLEELTEQGDNAQDTAKICGGQATGIRPRSLPEDHPLSVAVRPEDCAWLNLEGASLIPARRIKLIPARAADESPFRAYPSSLERPYC